MIFCLGDASHLKVGVKEFSSLTLNPTELVMLHILSQEARISNNAADDRKVEEMS